MPKKPSARQKLEEHFLKNLGGVMNSDELREVAGISEWARRIRELREEGYQILTHNDKSELKPGEYVLETTHRQPSFTRDISKETRALVLDRNGYTCQMCGIGAGEPHPDDNNRPARLHIGHIIDKSQGGSDEPKNLHALCSVCNEGASNISQARPDLIKLKAQVKRATGENQLDILKFLVEKFPNQANDLTNKKDGN